MANPSLQIGNSNWAIKEDNLLGYSTAGTRFVPQPITMTRASAGTRVNPQGLVETVELLGSELVTNGDFSNGTTGWTEEGSSTISVGTYQGRTNVANINIGNTSTSSRIQQLFDYVNGKTYQISVDVYLVSGSFRSDSRDAFVSGDFVSTSTTGSWLTLTSTFTAIQTGQDVVWLRSLGVVSQFYVDSISVKEVTKNNLARVDYDGTASSLLVEPERTNLIPYSEDFTTGSWSSFSVGTTPTLTSGFTAPDGSSNAYKISNPNKDSLWGYDGVADTNYARTIYARTVSGTGTISLLSKNGNADNVFSLTESWQRFEVNTAALVPNIFYAVDFRVSGNLTELLIWGGQSEVGSYPTSYIPTSGSTVTRVQDQYSKTGISNLIGQTEGTVFVDVDFDTLSGLNMFLSIRPDASNKIEIYRDSNIIYGEIASSSSFSFSKTGVTVGRYKIAVAYSSGSNVMYINGDLISSNSTPFTFTSTLNSLYVGSRGGTSFIEQSRYNDIKLYKTRLSNSELVTLTTI